jgi:hypothetical protein
MDALNHAGHDYEASGTSGSSPYCCSPAGNRASSGACSGWPTEDAKKGLSASFCVWGWRGVCSALLLALQCSPAGPLWPLTATPASTRTAVATATTTGAWQGARGAGRACQQWQQQEWLCS